MKLGCNFNRFDMEDRSNIELPTYLNKSLSEESEDLDLKNDSEKLNSGFSFKEYTQNTIPLDRLSSVSFPLTNKKSKVIVIIIILDAI